MQWRSSSRDVLGRRRATRIDRLNSVRRWLEVSAVRQRPVVGEVLASSSALASNPPIVFNGVFTVPMFKIYVGNLDPRVKIEQVRELFSPFVTIEDAVLVNDPASAKPKGFAIIMVRDPEIGRAAVKATQGKRLLGKTLTINEVMKKGQAAAKAAKETRQGPFGPHFNRQGGGGRAGTVRGGGSVRRGVNRGPRGSGSSGMSGGPPTGQSGAGGVAGSGGSSSSSRLGGPSSRPIGRPAAEGAPSQGPPIQPRKPGERAIPPDGSQVERGTDPTQ